MSLFIIRAVYIKHRPSEFCYLLVIERTGDFFNIKNYGFSGYGEIFFVCGNSLTT